ncbi:MAG: hypothetical protein K1X52_09370 [Pyrinomonadaceae bacterium]|nr:hypothetical protein [Pyrinomonadaceae bacterium]
MARTTFFTTLCILLSVFAAQGQLPSIENLPDKNGYISLSGKFYIALPSNFSGTGKATSFTTGTAVYGREISWSLVEGRITGTYLDYPDSSFTGTAKDLAELAKAFRSVIERNLYDAKLISDGSSMVNGIPSSYFVHDLGGGRAEIDRFFLVKKRLYWFKAEIHRGDPEVLIKTFGTFRLISDANIKQEILRNYEAAKPKPLPQSPAVRKLNSDAEDDGLKGHVREVREEIESESLTSEVKVKTLSSIVRYDRSGMRVQRDSYDSKGRPSYVAVYGYIDGRRVSNSKSIYYDDDPPMFGSGGFAQIKAPREPDPRYRYSYEYKYDDGKLIEEQIFFNDGSQSTRTVYKYAPNQLEELVYSSDGKLNQRYVSTLDAKGNMLAMTDVALPGFGFGSDGDRKYRYSYEFDKTGNWIKKATSREVKENGTSTYKPYSATYRTITYY